MGNPLYAIARAVLKTLLAATFIIMDLQAPPVQGSMVPAHVLEGQKEKMPVVSFKPACDHCGG